MKKYFAALVCSVLLLSGCDSGSPSPSGTVFSGSWMDPDREISDRFDISDNSDSSDSLDSSDSSDSLSASSSEPKVSKTELESADKNVWLFGKKLSLPCRFEEFGANFSLGEQYFYRAGNDLLAFLQYNGAVVGEVLLENCTEEDPNKSAKRVVQLALGDAENNPVDTVGWHNNEIFFDVLGITMRSAPDDVEELLGAPTEKRQLSAKKTLVTYKISNEKFIEITYKDDQIVEFVIESR